MNTTTKPQSANKKEIKMKPQSDKNQKTRIITIFLGLFIVLVGGGLLAATRFGDEMIAPVLMFLFALCFIFLAIWSKKNVWAIIPSGIFATIGLVTVPEILIPTSEVEGAIIMFLFALSFITFAILSKKNWWAVIPSGIFASVGLVVVLEDLIPHEEFPSVPFTPRWGVYNWVMFLGLAVTFGVLWLLRKTQSTDWAKYPAGGLAGLAMLSLILGARFQEFWAVSILLVSGVTIILALFTRKHMPSSGENETIKKNFPKGITHGNQS